MPRHQSSTTASDKTNQSQRFVLDTIIYIILTGFRIWGSSLCACTSSVLTVEITHCSFRSSPVSSKAASMCLQSHSREDRSVLAFPPKKKSVFPVASPGSVKGMFQPWPSLRPHVHGAGAWAECHSAAPGLWGSCGWGLGLSGSGSWPIISISKAHNIREWMRDWRHLWQYQIMPSSTWLWWSWNDVLLLHRWLAGNALNLLPFLWCLVCHSSTCVSHDVIKGVPTSQHLWFKCC